MGNPEAIGGRRLNVAGLDRARDVLARAYLDYPLYRLLYPDQSRRELALRWYMGFMLRYSLAYGEVFTAAEGEGYFSFLKGPERFTYRKLLTAGLQFGPIGMGVRPFWKMMRHDNHVSGVTSRLAPPGGWYLWILGVDPAAQGKGIGRRLVRRVLEAADAAGAPCYLDTDRFEMLKFLRFHGFDVVHEEKAPTSGLPFWAMHRGVRPPA